MQNEAAGRQCFPVTRPQFSPPTHTWKGRLILLGIEYTRAMTLFERTKRLKAQSLFNAVLNNGRLLVQLTLLLLNCCGTSLFFFVSPVLTNPLEGFVTGSLCWQMHYTWLHCMKKEGNSLFSNVDNSLIKANIVVNKIIMMSERNTQTLDMLIHAGRQNKTTRQ